MKIYDIYLPLRYNDGREIEPSKFDQTRIELVNRFNGLSVLPGEGLKIEGWWKSEDAVYRDEVRIFRVFCAADDEFFKEYKESLKTRFEQEEIFILSYDASAI